MAFDDAAIALCHEVDISAVYLIELSELRVQCLDQPLIVVVLGSSSLGAGQFLRLRLRCHGDGAAEEAEASSIGFSPRRITKEDRTNVMAGWSSTRQ